MWGFGIEEGWWWFFFVVVDEMGDVAGDDESSVSDSHFYFPHFRDFFLVLFPPPPINFNYGMRTGGKGGSISMCELHHGKLKIACRNMCLYVWMNAIFLGLFLTFSRSHTVKNKFKRSWGINLFCFSLLLNICYFFFSFPFSFLSDE